MRACTMAPWAHCACLLPTKRFPAGTSRCRSRRGAATAPPKKSRAALAKAAHGRITTEIADEPPFYHAEDYHQQYLARNPGGYCGLGCTDVSCPAGVSR